jgi:5-formaminoimidazole-4-carboxamide-1-(beta)-D-ribofuranosyl 5'-monophosphate synthetase
MMKQKIATIGSHSALQILRGAKDEGFETIVVTTPRNAKVYHAFGVADQFIELENYADFASIDARLVKENAIIVPHGSFNAYVSKADYDSLKTPVFGSKAILEWETDRLKQREWLEKSQLRVPKNFHSAGDIDRPTIVKYYGARGGKGYFFAKNEKEFEAGVEKSGRSPLIIQEYIVGVPFYIHYFHSALTGETEIMSMDKRYETNVDSLGRIPLKHQEDIDIDPSFVVVGNLPIVMRESMLAESLEMAERLVSASKKIAGPKGLYGPFCLETIITPEEEMYVIEVSARIVAGTNAFIPDSPYTALRYSKPVSTGRRIAMEIKQAIEENKLGSVLD